MAVPVVACGGACTGATLYMVEYGPVWLCMVVYIVAMVILPATTNCNNNNNIVTLSLYCNP